MFELPQQIFGTPVSPPTLAYLSLKDWTMDWKLIEIIVSSIVDFFRPWDLAFSSLSGQQNTQTHFSEVG